jgi:hypothetical protein
MKQVSGEGFAFAEGEEHVDVIRHDDVAPEVVALAVEVMPELRSIQRSCFRTKY